VALFFRTDALGERLDVRRVERGAAFLPPPEARTFFPRAVAFFPVVEVLRLDALRALPLPAVAFFPPLLARRERVELERRVVALFAPPAAAALRPFEEVCDFFRRVTLCGIGPSLRARLIRARDLHRPLIAGGEWELRSLARQ
jgi:hypothetical protein